LIFSDENSLLGNDGRGNYMLRNNDNSLYDVFLFFVATKPHAYRYSRDKAWIEKNENIKIKRLLAKRLSAK